MGCLSCQPQIFLVVSMSRPPFPFVSVTRERCLWHVGGPRLFACHGRQGRYLRWQVGVWGGLGGVCVGFSVTIWWFWAADIAESPSLSRDGLRWGSLWLGAAAAAGFHHAVAQMSSIWSFHILWVLRAQRSDPPADLMPASTSAARSSALL